MKTPNERFKEVRLALKKLPQNKFAKMSGISISSVQKIEGKEMEVSASTLELLELNCNVNPDYIKSGKAPMFKDNVVPDVNLINEPEDAPWKNEALQNLKNEVAFYRQLLSQVAGNGGFLTPVRKTG